jgi:hypothetical protein
MSEAANALPVNRLAAELGHYANVRRTEVQAPYRLLLRVTENGLNHSPLRTIREYGWWVTGFSGRHNTVSVLRQDRVSGNGVHKP